MFMAGVGAVTAMIVMAAVRTWRDRARVDTAQNDKREIGAAAGSNRGPR